MMKKAWLQIKGLADGLWELWPDAAFCWMPAACAPGVRADIMFSAINGQEGGDAPAKDGTPPTAEASAADAPAQEFATDYDTIKADPEDKNKWALWVLPGVCIIMLLVALDMGVRISLFSCVMLFIASISASLSMQKPGRVPVPIVEVNDDALVLTPRFATESTSIAYSDILGVEFILNTALLDVRRPDGSIDKSWNVDFDAVPSAEREEKRAAFERKMREFGILEQA